MTPTSFARQPLDVILSSGGAIRVLRALLAHGGQLSVSRLAADAQMTPMGTRAVLNDLIHTGVVRQSGSGHARLYQAADAHPLVIGFGRMFAAERDRFVAMIEAVKIAVAAREILAAWLFGSVARNTDSPESDVDIAIVIAGDLNQVADTVREAIRRTGEQSGFRVSITPMSPDDVVSHSDESSAFWQGLAGAIPLKGDTPKQLAGQIKAKR